MGPYTGEGIIPAALPEIQVMNYASRLISRHTPIDIHDKSTFSINIPANAKSLFKAAVDEYKQTNDMDQNEVALLDLFLQNLNTAKPPTTSPWEGGDNPKKALTNVEADETEESPQLFEYDDIALTGHILMKMIDLVPNPKKKKKKDEWVLEYFILLKTKHMIHFEPKVGFLDPESKAISGKTIDLMLAKMQMTEVNDALPSAVEKEKQEKEFETGEDNAFELRTARVLYVLWPKETPADIWVEKITDVMLADDESDEEESGKPADYSDFLVGYNEVKAS